jgi:pyruvate/2-oxoglutarate dehydrogenase complex dihydrolipoamide acyltransferase (E2) component
MNAKFARFFISMAVLTLSLLFGTNVRAQSPPPPPFPPAAPALLSQAYTDLSRADHDYHGHRARAMKLIEHAAKEMGISLQGDGHGREAQVTSDDQLRAAQGLLQSVVTGLPPKAQEHVQKAIEQISVALSLK